MCRLVTHCIEFEYLSDRVVVFGHVLTCLCNPLAILSCLNKNIRYTNCVICCDSESSSKFMLFVWSSVGAEWPVILKFIFDSNGWKHSKLLVRDLAQFLSYCHANLFDLFAFANRSSSSFLCPSAWQADSTVNPRAHCELLNWVQAAAAASTSTIWFWVDEKLVKIWFVDRLGGEQAIRVFLTLVFLVRGEAGCRMIVTSLSFSTHRLETR